MKHVKFSANACAATACCFGGIPLMGDGLQHQVEFDSSQDTPALEARFDHFVSNGLLTFWLAVMERPLLTTRARRARKV